MSLGQARTNRFNIGTAELRVGPLSASGKLTQKHSVGLIDDAKVAYSREVAQLKGGFPKKLVDETPISETTTITATLREYSQKNLDILLNQGDLATVTDVFSNCTAAITGGATTPEVTVASGASFTVGDTVVAYIVGHPEWVFVGKLLSKATNDLTLSEMDSDLYTQINTLIAGGSVLRVFRAVVSSVGNLAATAYYGVSLVQRDLKTGRPIVFNFWKVTAKGGMDYGTNATDYNSTSLSLEVLEPSAVDYAVGGDLEHLADIIPTAPMWQLLNSADVVA